MRGEIRGLLSKEYVADDGDCLLDIFTNDDGIHVVHVDFAAEIYYHYIINEKGNLINFEIGNPLGRPENEN